MLSFLSAFLSVFPATCRPFFQWRDSTAVAGAIRDCTWMFAVIEILHLLGLAVLLGSMVVCDLRLRGLGASPMAQLATELAPWIAGGLVFMVATGAPLFLLEAMKCYASPPFAIKMQLLVLAIAPYLALHSRARRMKDGARLPIWTKPATCLSLMLRFGVGLAGRAIGFQ